VPIAVTDRYQALVARGALERDPAQWGVISKLDSLAKALGERQLARKGSALGWLFGKRPQPALRGLYIWGAVGRGKTMLMDLFFEAAPVAAKRRVHFHAFMAEIHERIHAHRQAIRRGEAKDADPIPAVARAVADQVQLLCFDEFSVTDIADAMILGRLFSALFAEGVVVVATSNVEPSRLYEGGLNRALFEPFIALLQERLEVIQLAARTDFRLEKLAGAPVYFVPADAAARAAMDAIFARLSSGRRAQPDVLSVKGRMLQVPCAASGVARFGFADLCEEPLGAADYLAIAKRYSTVMLDAIPVMGQEQRNEARRFITLIDTLYDAHVKLIASAEAEPHALYTGSEGSEAFAFARTASRLIEMASTAYLGLPHGRPDSAASGSTTGLVET
jgi:cell division protein ZapE